MNIESGRTYYGSQGNNGRRAYTVESVTGLVTKSRSVLVGGQFVDETFTRVEVVGRRYFPSTGKTDKNSQTYYLPTGAEEVKGN